MAILGSAWMALMLPTVRGHMSTVALILVALWVLGSVSSLTMGGGLHILLLAASRHHAAPHYPGS